MAQARSSIIISIFSTSSGNGKTITAINLAASLTKEGYAVCLIDLDLQFGDIINYLKLKPKFTIEDAQLQLQRDPEKFNVKDYLTEYTHENPGHEFKFSVLAPPERIYDAYNIEVAKVVEIVERLNYFDFIVLDLGAVFSALNLAMLDLSTIINFLVVVDFLPSVKNFKIGYDTLIRFEYEESKIRLVENRADSQKLINGHDVERLVGESFFHRLPNDFPSVNKSILAGEPLIFAAPNSKLTNSFIELAGRYTNKQRQIIQTEPDDQSSGSLLSKIFSVFK